MERVKLLRYLNVAALLLVATFNSMDCFFSQKPLSRYLFFVVPFVIAAAVLVLWRNYKTTAGIYAFFGLTMTLTGSTGNFSGVIFLIFSIYIFNTAITNYALIGLASTVITARYLFMGYTIPDTLNLFVAYVFTFGVYFILIHPKPPAKPVIARVDDTTIDIVRYLKDGLRPKEIAPLVCLAPGTVSQRLSRARKRFGCGNNAELCEIFDDTGYFGKKLDKSDR